LFSVFNAVTQACLQEMVPFLLHHLKLAASKDPNKPTLPSTSPRWKQVRQDVKSYVGDVIEVVCQIMFLLQLYINKQWGNRSRNCSRAKFAEFCSFGMIPAF
jgi:hypothetical protein